MCLIHLFVLPAVAKIWRLLGLESALPADASVLAATVGSCIAAFFTYHIIEKPLGVAVEGKLSKAAVSAAALPVLGNLRGQNDAPICESIVRQSVPLSVC